MYSDSYDEFVKDFRAFCRTKGKCLENLPVNLDHLFRLASRHGTVDRSTPLAAWDSVSQSVTGGFLPGAILKELYCAHLEGFQAYIASLNKENATPTGSPQDGAKQHPPVQQLVPLRNQLSPDQPGKPQEQRSKLPAERRQLLQELQRRKGAAVSAIHLQPLAAAASPSPTQAVHRPQLVNTASPAAKPLLPAPNPQQQAVKPPRPTAKPARPVAQPPQPSAKLQPVGKTVQLPVKPPQPLAAAGARRSGRVRVQAARTGYVDSSLIPTDSSGSSSDSDSDQEDDSDSSDSDASAEADGIPWRGGSWELGPDYQAALPQLQQRPADGPTAAEARYIGSLMPTEGANAGPNPGVALGPGVFRGMWQQAGSGPARVKLLETWLDRMDQHMGQGMPQALGFSLLGSKLRSVWTPQQEILFALGMLDRYRMFKHIRRCYLPKRSVHELNSYYYNVWKNRAGPVPEEYAALHEDPWGDAVAWRKLLCRRLAATWDHSSMGPIPNLAQEDPVAAAAAAKLSRGRKVSVSRGSSDGGPASAAVQFTAAAVVNGNSATSRGAAADGAPAAAAVMISAAVAPGSSKGLESAAQAARSSGSKAVAAAADGHGTKHAGHVQPASAAGSFLQRLQHAVGKAVTSSAARSQERPVPAAVEAVTHSTQADAAALLRARHKHQQQRTGAAADAKAMSSAGSPRHAQPQQHHKQEGAQLPKIATHQQPQRQQQKESEVDVQAKPDSPLGLSKLLLQRKQQLSSVPAAAASLSGSLQQRHQKQEQAVHQQPKLSGFQLSAGGPSAAASQDSLQVSATSSKEASSETPGHSSSATSSGQTSGSDGAIDSESAGSASAGSPEASASASAGSGASSDVSKSQNSNEPAADSAGDQPEGADRDASVSSSHSGGQPADESSPGSESAGADSGSGQNVERSLEGSEAAADGSGDRHSGDADNQDNASISQSDYDDGPSSSSSSKDTSSNSEGDSSDTGSSSSSRKEESSDNETAGIGPIGRENRQGLSSSSRGISSEQGISESGRSSSSSENSSDVASDPASSPSSSAPSGTPTPPRKRLRTTAAVATPQAAMPCVVNLASDDSDSESGNPQNQPQEKQRWRRSPPSIAGHKRQRNGSVEPGRPDAGSGGAQLWKEDDDGVICIDSD